MSSRGSLFIISAPSGAGKTSLVKALLQEMKDVCVSISYTTRPMRPTEREGVDYHFITPAVFETMLAEGIFLEHAQVFGNFYGTSREWVEAARNRGLDVILEIDWQGAQQVCRQHPEAEGIFILPLARGILLERLKKRHQDNMEIIEERMNEAKDHIVHYKEYGYLIINEDFQEALQNLKAIICCDRLRLERQVEDQKELLKKLLS